MKILTLMFIGLLVFSMMALVPAEVESTATSSDGTSSAESTKCGVICRLYDWMENLIPLMRSC